MNKDCAICLALGDICVTCEEISAHVPPAGDVEVLRKRLESARSRFSRWNGRLIECLREERVAVTRLTAERDGLLAEVERLRKVTNFEEAVACVFDNLKFAAANTGSKEWDDQLEDLAEEVIEYAPKYKKQWKDICSLQSELTKARELNPINWTDRQVLDFLGVALRNVDLAGEVRLSEIRQGFQFMQERMTVSATDTNSMTRTIDPYMVAPAAKDESDE